MVQDTSSETNNDQNTPTPHQPQPVPPMQPTQAPLQQPVPAPTQQSLKNKMPVFVRIIIGIAGTIVLVLAGLFVIGFVVGTSDKKTTDTTTTASYDMSTYQNSRISFKYPTDWTKKDTSNVTSVILGRVVVDKVIFQKDKDVVLKYVMLSSDSTPSTTPVTEEKRLSGMQTAVANYESMTNTEMKSYVSSDGFGCLDSFSYVDKPRLIQRGNFIGAQFTYSCTSSVYGVPITNIHVDWYDENGVRNIMTIAATNTYWESNEAMIREVADSAAVL